jgi:hypothetical protein
VDRNVTEVGGVDRGIAYAHRAHFNFGKEARLTQRILSESGIEDLLAWTHHREPGGYDEVVGRVLNRRDGLKVGSNARNDDVTVAHAPSSTTGCVLEAMCCDFVNPARRVDVSDVDILKLIVGIRVLSERFIVDSCYVL